MNFGFFTTSPKFRIVTLRLSVRASPDFRGLAIK